MKNLLKAVTVSAVVSALLVLNINSADASTLGDNVTYGNVWPTSTCSGISYDADGDGYPESGYCRVVIQNGTLYTKTYVKKTALVKYCFNNTLTVDSVISPGSDDMLAYYYVAVIWGGLGKVGAITCH